MTPADSDADGFDETVDCNDDDPEVNPEATELCDGQDNDCDDQVDEDDAADAGTWYLDEDGDAYGVAEVAVTACEAPSGYAAWDETGFDCDDTDAAIHPGATEVCDGGVDNDCSGLADDEDSSTDYTGETTYYSDSDGDGDGDHADAGAPYCSQPDLTSTNADDCNDTNGDIHPHFREACGIFAALLHGSRLTPLGGWTKL